MSLACKSIGVVVLDDNFFAACFDWGKNAGMKHFLFSCYVYRLFMGWKWQGLYKYSIECYYEKRNGEYVIVGNFKGILLKICLCRRREGT